MGLTKTVTEGLYPGETVLLILGIVLFVVLIFAFVYQLTRQRSLGPLLGFFVVPIVMIGYPSIRSIEFKDGVVSIDKTTQQLLSNPTDASVRESLQKQLEQTTRRPIANPKDAAAVAKAQFALGDEQAAALNLQKALQKDPNLPEARQLQKKMEVAQNLQRLSVQVERNPADQAARAELQKNVSEAAQMQWANHNAVIALARAQTALGDHAHALETVNKALAINPKAVPAQQLKETILLKVPPRS